MKRALFIVSEHGNGHRVRCGALADELRGRGWECETRPVSSGSTLDLGEIEAAVAISDAGNEEFEVQLGLGVPLAVITDRPPHKTPGASLLVCGNAGATPEMFKDSGAGKVLAGPEYALLRREFRPDYFFYSGPLRRRGTFDVRFLEERSAEYIAIHMIGAANVITYGGMRASEASCCGAALIMQPRNEAERLNVKGIAAGAYIDGLGTKRVADEIEALFS